MSLIGGDEFSGLTSIERRCINGLFQDCTGLVDAGDMVLPATTLSYWCYSFMFLGCTSLTTAPVLPAATLDADSYYGMFYGCSSLNYIKCLATDISATNCTYNWVVNVAPTGTFVKELSMNDWTVGVSGIPSGWTVKNYTSGTSIIVGQLSGGTIGLGNNCEANFVNGQFSVGGVTAGTLSNVGDYIVVDGGQFGWSNITYDAAQEVEFSYNWSGDHHVYTSNCYLSLIVTDGVHTVNGVIMNNHSISTAILDLTPFWTNDTTLHNLTVTINATIN